MFHYISALICSTLSFCLYMFYIQWLSMCLFLLINCTAALRCLQCVVTEMIINNSGLDFHCIHGYLGNYYRCRDVSTLCQNWHPFRIKSLLSLPFMFVSLILGEGTKSPKHISWIAPHHNKTWTLKCCFICCGRLLTTFDVVNVITYFFHLCLMP